MYKHHVTTQYYMFKVERFFLELEVTLLFERAILSHVISHFELGELRAWCHTMRLLLEDDDETELDFHVVTSDGCGD